MNLPAEQLAVDRAGNLHTHDWHTTLGGEIRCTVCSLLHELPNRNN